jgi:hypothetical protein
VRAWPYACVAFQNMEQAPPSKPEEPPYLEKHYRGQPSVNQLGLILSHHGPELLGRQPLREELRKLSNDLMAPTATQAEVKIRDAAWAKRDEVWAAYHRACRKYEEAQEEPPTKKSRAERKADPDKTKNDELQKAAEDTKKAHEYLAKMQANHEKDLEGVAAQFKALIDDESTRPAIEAIMKSGMCECAGAHANLCAWVLMMWLAATRFRLEHGDAAPERLASMNDGAVSAYLVDASVEIKVLRHLRIH